MRHDENEGFYISGGWRCCNCKEKKTRMRLFKDILFDRNEDGTRLGLCHECQEKINEELPEVRNAQASLKARLAVEKGTPPILQHVRKFEQIPGWWKRSSHYPKSS